MFVKLSSSTLRKAAEIQERIERLQEELGRLLPASAEASSAPVAVAPTPRVVAKRTGWKKSCRRRLGRKEQGSPIHFAYGSSGSSRCPSSSIEEMPMNVSEILEGLMSNGYKFASPEPKKNLFARIYRLKGVKQVGPGKFTADKSQSV